MSDLSDDRCIASYEDELEKMITTNLQQQEDLARQKLFLAFQNAAKQVTKMFRANHPAQMNWNSFHAAAEAVTVLYKESLDGLKEAMQLGMVTGEHRKTKEMLNWTRRKQRRHVSTTEIYEHLIGQTVSQPSTDLASTSIDSTSSPPVIDDLQTFRQALVIDDRPDQSGHLESFVREQMADQLARKRSCCSNDLQRVKRIRYV